jgi:NADH dehydrogenase
VVFGPEDQFFNRIAALAQVAPFLPVIAGSTRLQPVHVGDVADAVLAALADPAASGRTFELGGPAVRTLRELMAWVVADLHRSCRLVDLPDWLARLLASVLERVPGKPLTRDQLLLLQRDNVVSAGAAGLAELGVRPTPLELVVPRYLARFRAPTYMPDDSAEPAPLGQDIQ